MCGKFTAMMSWREYCALAGVNPGAGDHGASAVDADKSLGIFTPMSAVPVLHRGPIGQRRITPMRWGWYKHKLPDPRRGFSHLHARAEDIDRTPTWIEPFHEARGVVFTHAFNIGEELPGGKVKQWICSRADGAPIAIAMLYSVWEHATFGTLRTCVMVTTAACPPLSSRDSRMPALLAGEDEIENLAWRNRSATCCRQVRAAALCRRARHARAGGQSGFADRREAAQGSRTGVTRFAILSTEGVALARSPTPARPLKPRRRGPAVSWRNRPPTRAAMFRR